MQPTAAQTVEAPLNAGGFAPKMTVKKKCLACRALCGGYGYGYGYGLSLKPAGCPSTAGMGSCNPRRLRKYRSNNYIKKERLALIWQALQTYNNLKHLPNQRKALCFFNRRAAMDYLAVVLAAVLRATGLAVFVAFLASVFGAGATTGFASATQSA